MLYSMYLQLSSFFVAILASGLGALVYPPGWHDAPGTLEEFREGNAYNINPWRYSHRLGAYKIIVEETAFAMKQFGANNSGNILWGLPLQFGWQFTSQRIRDHSNQTDCGFTTNRKCVSYRSWWASMNYYLSIIPFLGMVKAGYFQVSPQLIRIQHPDGDAQLYCTDMDSCDKIEPKLLTKWSEFFLLLRTSNHSDTEDTYLSAMWKAHVQSIATAMPLFKGRQSLMSSQEQNFGVNWANSVSFIAATHFSTNNNNTATYQKDYMPMRLLWDSDHPPNVPGLSPNQNKALVVMKLLVKLNYYTGGWFLSAWEKAMCTPEGRKLGRQVLETVIPNTWSAIAAMFRLIKVALTTPC